MSIAVSAVVKPSRLLLTMVGGMCTGIVFVGLMIGAGQIGDLAFLPKISFAVVCVFLAIFGFFRTVQTRKTHHIDISDIGQIRLAEYSPLATSPSQIVLSQVRCTGDVVSLMADSTLWSRMLLLRLKTKDQRIMVLPVLPDSINGCGFRALSVACRWIAAHNNLAE